MKTIKTHLRVLVLFCSLIIFFQGCTVYKSIPVSIEQAVQNQSQVRVKTRSKKKMKFSRIIIVDGNHFGVKKTSSDIIYTPLDENTINTINEKDKTVSTIVSVAGPILFIFLVLIGAAMANGGYVY